MNLNTLLRVRFNSRNQSNQKIVEQVISKIREIQDHFALEIGPSIEVDGIDDDGADYFELYGSREAMKMFIELWNAGYSQFGNAGLVPV